MKLQSLDPRINRLGIEENTNEFSNSLLDQGDTYEAFIQTKEDKPFEHVGPVHAPNEQMAILFAKEQYSRRGGTCIGLSIVKTQDVMVSDYVDNNQNVYENNTSNNNEGRDLSSLTLIICKMSCVVNCDIEIPSIETMKSSCGNRPA